MGKRVDSGIIKKSLQKITQYIPTEIHTMGWYFRSERPENALVFEKDKWTCMFQHIEQIANGKQICFSPDLTGCSGSACYLGFKTPGPHAGSFLVEKERFKKCIEYGQAFYNEIQAVKAREKYLILGRIQDIPDNTSIEVINLWVNATALAGLVTLANYDRPTNNNVIIPFASGCQSMWTMPYKEKTSREPKAVVGCMDPAMRKHIPSEVLPFSLPSGRFVDLVENAQDSFLQDDSWRDLFI